MVERVSCALRLDGDTWGGRHAKDLGGVVKREDFVLIGGIWGRWRSRMRAQQGGARIYLLERVKVSLVMISQFRLLFSS